MAELPMVTDIFPNKETQIAADFGLTQEFFDNVNLEIPYSHPLNTIARHFGSRIDWLFLTEYIKREVVEV